MCQSRLVHTPYTSHQTCRRLQHRAEITQLHAVQKAPVAPREPVALFILAFQIKNGRRAVAEEEILRVGGTDYAEFGTFDYPHGPAEAVSEIVRRFLGIAESTAVRFGACGIVYPDDSPYPILHGDIMRVARIVEKLHDIFPVRGEEGVLHAAARSVRVKDIFYCFSAFQHSSKDFTAIHVVLPFPMSYCVICRVPFRPWAAL